ncbi:TOBE domain-containing protein [Streptomyces sp. NPDC001584]|uniref:TOBE domain-containing protein n=1 Tax=Streptomyces sp. NPDC001584 TaxID=3154521 RepID=UPI00332AD7A1
MQQYSLSQAARLLGVSRDTTRRWANTGRIPAHWERRGGMDRLLIDGRHLAAFAVSLAQVASGDEATAPSSARNSFPGIITAVRLGDVSAQVEIQAGPHRVVSLLTRESVEEMGLEVGMRATARVKSSSVHLDVP